MNIFQRWFNYRILRMNVRTRQRREKFVFNSGYRLLTKEELAMVKKIEDLAIKHRDGIRYDPESQEILIIAPDVLIVLKKKGKIEINNHNGFAQMVIPDNAFSLLTKIIDREAHRERRRLKNEVKQNLRSFINKIKA